MLVCTSVRVCVLQYEKRNHNLKTERLLDAGLKPRGVGVPSVSRLLPSPLLAGRTSCPRYSLAAQVDSRDPGQSSPRDSRLPPASGKRGEGPAVGYCEWPLAIGVVIPGYIYQVRYYSSSRHVVRSYSSTWIIFCFNNKKEINIEYERTAYHTICKFSKNGI